MSQEQEQAQALLDNPETFRVLSGNEIRVCQSIVEDPFFLEVDQTGFPFEEYEEDIAAAKADNDTFKSLLTQFSKEIDQWKRSAGKP